jgi:16S rRNA (cytosine1402-N4)-methyltransferase
MTDTQTQDGKNTLHTPVLLQEVIELLNVAPTDVILDGTAGGGGHLTALLSKLGPDGKYIAIDADATALDRVRERVGQDDRVSYVCGNFRHMTHLLQGIGIASVDKVLLDLGLSSDQLEGESGRGFSFIRDEPLSMTFKAQTAEGELTAWHVVNEWDETSLADIIYGFGGEPRARGIARAISARREEQPIETSLELAQLIEDAMGRRGKRHPATRTFQAIRMAVNDELGALTEGLEHARHLVRGGGRIAVITFHGLEDRIVKRAFREWAKEGDGVVLTKHPIPPERSEVLANPRARSAKIRCFQIATTQ